MAGRWFSVYEYLLYVHANNFTSNHQSPNYKIDIAKHACKPREVQGTDRRIGKTEACCLPVLLQIHWETLPQRNELDNDKIRQQTWSSEHHTCAQECVSICTYKCTPPQTQTHIDTSIYTHTQTRTVITYPYIQKYIEVIFMQHKVNTVKRISYWHCCM